ncbi:MAG: hypothetical protein PUA76_07530 [Bacteroidales bacterium]|nr:hypothetical protein [Bacteroidales bacterium]
MRVIYGGRRSQPPRSTIRGRARKIAPLQPTGSCSSCAPVISHFAFKPNKSIAQKAKNWAKKHIYARWKSWNLWMQVGVVITAFGIGMFVWYTFGDIFFKSHVDSGKYITNDDLGNLGDLLGGLCGGLFSLAGVFLLIETLRRQRVEFTKNQYVTTVQQFNDLFFHMLNLYESVLDSMGGRKFFMDNFQAIYRSFKAGNAIDIAINTYINFYDNNSTKVSHYFRVLYRIFDLIDNIFFSIFLIFPALPCSTIKKFKHMQLTTPLNPSPSNLQLPTPMASRSAYPV